MKSKDQTTDIKLSIVIVKPGKIKFLKTSHFALKRYFFDFLKTSQGPNHWKGIFLTACQPDWYLWMREPSSNPKLETPTCFCAFAKILLQLFSCLCQPCCCWIYYQPFKNHLRYCVHTWTGPSWILIDCFLKVSLSQFLLLLKVKWRLLQYLYKNQGTNL